MKWVENKIVNFIIQCGFIILATIAGASFTRYENNTERFKNKLEKKVDKDVFDVAIGNKVDKVEFDAYRRANDDKWNDFMNRYDKSELRAEKSDERIFKIYEILSKSK